MPKVSEQAATKVAEFGVAEDRSADLDGYTVSFVSIRQSHDLAPMLKSLPGGSCPCPHWGYVLKGRLIVRCDGAAEELLEVGDAFYLPPATLRRPRQAPKSCRSAPR